MKRVGIIGCGWLGFSLAEEFLSQGFEVRGTTTSLAKTAILSEKRIAPFIFQLGEVLPDSFFDALDYLIICFPISSKHSTEKYADFCSQLNSKVVTSTQLIFTSSTSVYSQDQDLTDERNGKIDPDSINYYLEHRLTHYFPNKLTILRLGGLINETRHPIVHLAGRKEISNGNAPVNLVHRNDVIRMIMKCIELNIEGELLNCVYPFHPSKAAYYTLKAKEFQLEPPTFTSDENSMHKVVSSQKAMDMLLFDFIYPI